MSATVYAIVPRDYEVPGVAIDSLWDCEQCAGLRWLDLPDRDKWRVIEIPVKYVEGEWSTQDVKFTPRLDS